jgi:hypothetical protein
MQVCCHFSQHSAKWPCVVCAAVLRALGAPTCRQARCCARNCWHCPLHSHSNHVLLLTALFYARQCCSRHGSAVLRTAALLYAPSLTGAPGGALLKVRLVRLLAGRLKLERPAAAVVKRETHTQKAGR